MTQEDLQKNFAPYEVPSELVALLNFDSISQEWYSGRFQFEESGGLPMLDTYNIDKNFQNALKGIAQTSSSGTLVFIWICDATKSISEQPIVIFGDEGGFDVLFENVKDLLHYLSFNTSIYGANGIGYKDETYNENPRVEEYATWLKDNFNLDPITSEQAELMNAKAKEKYGQLFANWMKNYFQ